MENNAEIMVSICCLAYNHEKYIRQTLDGFLMQKTNFKYEILVHDDASTDKTADIIREYEAKYPDIFKPIYQKENQYSKGIKIGTQYQYPRVRGKYVAFCEGDDFWCDKKKLQIQFEIMEEHIEYSMCVHPSYKVSDDGDKVGVMGIYNQNTIVDANRFLHDRFIKYEMPFQTSSVFARGEYVKELTDFIKSIKTKLGVGDILLTLFYLTKGNIYYCNRKMSCYRVNVPGGWTSKINKDVSKRILHNENLILFLDEYDKYSNYKYSEVIEKSKHRLEFTNYMIKKDYKNMCRRKYKRYFNEQDRKFRIYARICANIPFFEQLYSNVKGS